MLERNAGLGAETGWEESEAWHGRFNVDISLAEGFEG